VDDPRFYEMTPEQREVVRIAVAQEQERWRRQAEDVRVSGAQLPTLLVIGTVLVVFIAWIAYGFGHDDGEDSAWTTAEQRAIQVALRGFCAAGDEALVEVEGSADVLEETPTQILLLRIAGVLVAESEFRFPGRHAEATNAFTNPLDQHGLICGELAFPGGRAVSALAGIEPDDIRP
jgi:hypothetical protein